MRKGDTAGKVQGCAPTCPALLPPNCVPHSSPSSTVLQTLRGEPARKTTTQRTSCVLLVPGRELPAALAQHPTPTPTIRPAPSPLCQARRSSPAGEKGRPSWLGLYPRLPKPWSPLPAGVSRLFPEAPARRFLPGRPRIRPRQQAPERTSPGARGPRRKGTATGAGCRVERDWGGDFFPIRSCIAPAHRA